MNISFFDFTVNFGGGPQGSLYLMKRLKDAGHNCTIVDAFGASIEYRNKASQYDLEYYLLLDKKNSAIIGYNQNPIKRILKSIKQAPDLSLITINLTRLLSKIKPDVVIVNNEKTLFFLLAAKFLLRFKVLLYFRGEGLDSQLTPRFIYLINLGCNHVVAHSKTAVRNLKKHGVLESKLSYVPNCIESDKFITPVKSADLQRKGTSFKIILPAARYVHEKGHHTAIEAINILRKSGYNIQLFLPGTIPNGSNTTYYDFLKELVRKYELENSVHFIGWRKRLISDIVACDLTILPSHTEGFPRAVIESMIHGIPVCATPVGGIPEAIIDMENGMLFDIDNAKQLSDCIKTLIDNNELYQSISQSAQRSSRAYFNPENNTNGILAILNSM